jgi:hypothetical protein
MSAPTAGEGAPSTAFEQSVCSILPMSLFEAPAGSSQMRKQPSGTDLSTTLTFTRLSSQAFDLTGSRSRYVSFRVNLYTMMIKMIMPAAMRAMMMVAVKISVDSSVTVDVVGFCVRTATEISPDAVTPVQFSSELVSRAITGDVEFTESLNRLRMR